ncbi:MAG TPA: hypothetical protein VID29_01080 [Solirubrobacteraceae bacterium]|jgi:hypothetical protein
MRTGGGKLSRTIGATALLALLALAGCGSGAKPANKGGITFNGKTATLQFLSPVAGNGGVLPAANTCDGTNTWPAMGWSTVPPETAELVLFVVAFSPSGSLSVQWALGGLRPETHLIEPRKLPAGAVLGRNNIGRTRYSICPTRGTTASYLFILYALPRPLNLHRGFSGQEVLGKVSEASFNAPFGAFITTYKRA